MFAADDTAKYDLYKLGPYTNQYLLIVERPVGTRKSTPFLTKAQVWERAQRFSQPNKMHKGLLAINIVDAEGNHKCVQEATVKGPKVTVDVTVKATPKVKAPKPSEAPAKPSQDDVLKMLTT
jgi:hypothetical protein